MKSKIERLAVFVVLIIGGGIALLFFSNEFNRAGIFSAGNIEEGTKFGISIGMDHSEAAELLVADGLIFSMDLEEGERCLQRTWSPDQKVEVWLDQSWRRGLICLAVEDSTVVSLGWRYGLGPVLIS